MRKIKEQRKSAKGCSIAVVALGVSVIAFFISFFGTVYLPYWYEKHKLSLMISGFSYTSYVDSTGIMPEHRLLVDLVFTNSGNRTEAVLGTRFLIHQFNTDNPFSNRWSVGYQPVHIEPFMIAPGEIQVFRLDQPVNEDTTIDPLRRYMLLNASDSALFKQLVSLRITVRDPDDEVPREHVIPVAEATISFSPFLSWRTFTTESLDNPFGGVIKADNLLEGGTTGRACFTDAINFLNQ